MPGRARSFVVRLFAAATLSIVASAAAGAELHRSAFGFVAQELLEGSHAVVVPCTLALASDTVCFVVEPATVAVLAEGIEAMVARSDGGLQRSPWRSANGVHSVDLTFADTVWGALEVWLRDDGDRAVSGMLRYVPHRRVKGL